VHYYSYIPLRGLCANARERACVVAYLSKNNGGRFVRTFILGVFRNPSEENLPIQLLLGFIYCFMHRSLKVRLHRPLAALLFPSNYYHEGRMDKRKVSVQGRSERCIWTSHGRTRLLVIARAAF
jgi:hypothetical protein